GVLLLVRVSGGAPPSCGRGRFPPCLPCYLGPMGGADDKRAERRVSYPCEVDCTGVGVGMSVTSPRISDLSVSGAFVDSMVTVPRGTRLRMKFSLPSLVVDCVAEVMHEMPQF